MRVAIISSDQGIHRLSREILRDFGGPSCQLLAADYDTKTPLPEADLYVWDFAAGVDLSNRREFLSTVESVFVVDRDSLDLLRHQIPDLVTQVLLKPVDPVLLRWYLKKPKDRNSQAVPINGVSSWNGDGLGQNAHGSAQEDMLQLMLEMNVRLQEYERDRTQFVCQVLHGLREPLVALDGYCDLLLDQKFGPMTREQSNVVQRMKQSVKRLFRLAGSTIQLSVEDAIRSVPQVRLESIEQCVASSVEEIEGLARDRRVKIGVDLVAPAEEFWFDRAQIEQVVVNLLDNACRQSPRDSQILVTASPVFWDRRAPNLVDLRNHDDRRRLGSQAPNAFQIEVRDQGALIPSDRLERLFQEDSPLGANSSAMNGLGLAICKQIIGRHGGRIFAESTEGGNRFVFVLPLDNRPAKAAGRNTGVNGHGTRAAAS